MFLNKTLVLFFVLIPFYCPAQSDAELLKIADSLYNKESDFDRAFKFFEKARHGFSKKNEWSKAIECVTECGYILFDKREYTKATAYLLQHIPNFERQKNKIDPIKYTGLLLCTALNFKKLENYKAALQYYEIAIDHFKEHNVNHKNFAYAYKNAAQIYERRLNYSNLSKYLEEALHVDSTGAYLAEIYGHLASHYIMFSKYDKAIKSALKGLSYDYSLADELLLNNALIDANLELGKINEAEKGAKRNIQIIRSNIDWGYTPWVEYKLLAKTSKAKNKNIEALKFYLKSLEEVKKERVGKDREIAKVESEIGQFYFDNKKLDQALSHYQQALIQIFPNFNSTNIADNPSIDDIYTESWIMTASARKGEALRARYDLNTDINDLKNAAECFGLSLAGIKALTDSYGTDNAKLYLSDYSHNYFEKAIEVNYLLLKETGDQQYIEKIFSIMERSKANVLTEAIQKNRGLILAGIPDSLLSMEQDLRLELADLNKSIKLEELYEAEADEEHISELRSRMTTRQREYEELLANLKNEYPQFKSYTEEPLTPTVAAVRQYLSEKGESLLEYFVGEKHVYLMRIDGKEASVYQLPHNDFWNDVVADFQDYFRNSSAIINDPKGYFAAAETLYQQLFPFDSLPDKIILVPDAELNFIPIDALVSKQPKRPNFTEANFLLHNKQIRYAYSVGLLLSPPPALRTTKEFLRIAPLFANRERGQAPLANGNQPIEPIPQLQTLTGAAATFAAFKSQAPISKLVHLSTHAGADETDFAPRIEFIDTSLYLPELYAMHIPAELVVLSACETGLGKFEKGEGVMSLARGFAYAGAGSLVASLWKVNEGSTAALFNHFYTFLTADMSKSEALRAAKLQYMEGAKSEAKMSPYYWAGFVPIGHDAPMDFSQQRDWWSMATVLGVGLILLVVWKQSRKVFFGRTPPRHEKGVVSN